MNKLHQTIFDANPTMMLISDSETGKIIEVNRSFLDKTGIKGDEILNQNLFDLEIFDNIRPVDFFNQVVLEADAEAKEVHIKGKGDELIYTMYTFDLYRTSDGTNLLISYFFDITAKKIFEKKMKSANEMMGILMNMADEYVNLPLEQVDELINKTLSELALFVNADRAYVFDYDFEAKTTTNTYEWCNEGITSEINNLQSVPLELFPDWLNAHLKGENMYIKNVQALPEGGLKDILNPQGIKSLLALPMMNGSECMGFVGFDSVRDYHIYTDRERQLLELFSKVLVNIYIRIDYQKRLIEATEEANRSNAYKSEFISNMSHDLRTPLNSIIGMAQILNEIKHTEEEARYLKILMTASDNLLSLINDVLDISRIESGQLMLQEKDFELRQLMKTCKDMFISLAGEKGLTLKMAVQKSLPKRYYGDAEKLKRILINLIGNAVKFTQKGSVVIQAITNNTDGHPGNLYFMVKDTGMGIAADEKEKIFERFSRSTGVEEQKINGSGLGLTITKAMIEMMGGEIWVESEINNGSTFYFTLDLKKPSSDNKEITTKISKKEQNHFEGKKILLVDDSKENRLVIKLLLRNTKVEIQEAANGAEAVKMFQENDFDLILMDMQMPIMDGFEATRKIRSLGKNNHVPIIALTAFAFKEDIEKTVSSGCDSHLSKPVKKNLLMEIMSFYLESF